MLHQLLGFFLGCVVRALSLTWRVTLVLPDGLFASASPLVFAFWHGKQLALLAAPRRRPALVMVSHSRDGKIQASAMRLLEFRVVRGSSSRGAATATKSLLRQLASGTLDAVFAVDGPRGPRERAKAGAARVASMCGGALVAVGCASSKRFVLRRAWDRFEIPFPFARVAIVVSHPVDSSAPEVLSAAIDDAQCVAQATLDRAKVPRESIESA